MAKELKEKNPLAVTEKGLALITALRELGDEVTAKEVAEHLDVKPSSVTGTMNALVKREIGMRTEVTVTDENDKDVVIKFLGLTDFGKTADFIVE